MLGTIRWFDKADGGQVTELGGTGQAMPTATAADLFKIAQLLNNASGKVLLNLSEPLCAVVSVDTSGCADSDTSHASRHVE